MARKPRPRLPDIVRFERHVKAAPNGCLLWTGGTNGHGYGVFRVGSKARGDYRHISAHKFVWERANGAVPQGFTVDHVKDRGCISTLCVRLDHLEAVPHATNLARGKTVNALNSSKQACPRCGGPYSERPSRRNPSRAERYCQPCATVAQRTRRSIP